jgi:predicted sugar kinase
VIFHWRPKPPDAGAALEADRLARVAAAAPAVSAETGRLTDEALWPALDNDDLEGFARALEAIQGLNREAGAWDAPEAETQAVLDVLRANGAVTAGESPTGLARYALIRGASPSVALRNALRAHVGVEGGTVMATICDVRGARHRVPPRSPA